MDLKEAINFGKDIKSKFIQKDKLSHLKEYQILNLIKYNKDLQKECGVDIEYYKKKRKIYSRGKKWKRI